MEIWKTLASSLAIYVMATSATLADAPNSDPTEEGPPLSLLVEVEPVIQVALQDETGEEDDLDDLLGDGDDLPDFDDDLPQNTNDDENIQIGGLRGNRRSIAANPGSNFLLGDQARDQPAMDLAGLLGKDSRILSTAAQERNPVVHDIRTRGNHVGQLLASGSFWVPSRMDLDTMLSKLDSRVIEDVIVIKGPYSARYGPGFNFVDFILIPAERFPEGQDSFGMTTFEYEENGDQLYGRQTLWTGGENWGARITYGHHVGEDYRTGDGNGAGFNVRSSYNSRDWVLALGYDLSEHRRLDFHALRLDQTDIEFPGYAFDMRYLVTDGYELRYVDECPVNADRFEAEVWYNATRFEGFANENFGGPDPLSTVDADNLSAGYRALATWGCPECCESTIGTDLIYYTNAIFERIPNPGAPPPPTIVNASLADAYSIDFGLFADRRWRANECTEYTAGARVDLIHTDADPDPFIFPTSARTRVTYATYLTRRREIDSCVTIQTGVAHALRPPSLTELYSDNIFMGLLQPGLTFFAGDPDLDDERLTQVDVGLEFEYPRLRGQFSGFGAYYNNYITFTPAAITPGPGVGTGTTFQNTNHVIMYGLELFAEYDVNEAVALFVSSSWLEGKDLSRDESAVGLAPQPFFGDEWLPGIAPLDSTLGLRLHDPCDDLYSVEFSMRIVDEKRNVARTLSENRTPGFVTFDIRGQAQMTDNWRMIIGVENVTDRFYIEHLDLRTGRGVFRPGRNVYVGSEVTY